MVVNVHILLWNLLQLLLNESVTYIKDDKGELYLDIVVATTGYEDDGNNVMKMLWKAWFTSVMVSIVHCIVIAIGATMLVCTYILTL